MHGKSLVRSYQQSTMSFTYRIKRKERNKLFTLENLYTTFLQPKIPYTLVYLKLPVKPRGDYYKYSFDFCKLLFYNMVMPQGHFLFKKLSFSSQTVIRPQIWNLRVFSLVNGLIRRRFCNFPFYNLEQHLLRQMLKFL